MKAVLISIQPKWCELIASGKKTVEVRKTEPKLEAPFKVYIYCTHSNGTLIQRKGNKFLGYTETSICGKVIGEFVCRNIDEYDYDQAFDESMGCFIDKFGYDITSYELGQTCLTYEEFENYGNTQRLYGWHISDLVIYDKPKNLSEFCSYNVKAYIDESGYPMPTHEIKRPPQSWCYVEERKE